MSKITKAQVEKAIAESQADFRKDWGVNVGSEVAISANGEWVTVWGNASAGYDFDADYAITDIDAIVAECNIQQAWFSKANA